jgi:hypothetical protein
MTTRTPEKLETDEINDKNAAAIKHLEKFLDTGTWDDELSSTHMPSAIEKFVERGEKVEDLLLRGHFWSRDHANAFVRLLRKAVHFKDEELQTMLLNHAAAIPSVNGERIDILLRAVVGAYGQPKKESIGGKFRKAIGLDKEAQQ